MIAVNRKEWHSSCLTIATGRATMPG